MPAKMIAVLDFQLDGRVHQPPSGYGIERNEQDNVVVGFNEQG